MEPTAQGVLSKTPLAHLIVYCVEKKLGGALVLRPEGNDDNAAADVVTLVDGWPAKIRVVEAIEHLGRILVELGAIDDVAYSESLMALASGGLQGQLLLQKGRIDASALERGLRTQIARKVGHLFTRPASTRYAFYAGVDFLQRYGGPELLPVDPTAAVFASIRSNPSMPHADATLDKVANVPLRVRPGVDVRRLDLTRLEAEVFARLQRQAMTPQQIASLGILDARAAKLLTYGLLLMKMLDAVGAPRSTVPPATPTIVPTPPGAGGSVVGASSVRPSSAPPPAAPSASVRPAPGASSPPARSPQERRAEILAKVESLATQNAFQLLDVPSSAANDDVQHAYFSAARQWQPDRLPPELADLRDAVARVQSALAAAYQTLSDPARRAAYVAQLSSSGADPQRGARAQEVKSAFQKAEVLLAQGQFAEAEPFVVRALEISANDPDSVALWCWVQANKPDRREALRYDDLLGRLDGALADNPKSERARFHRGMVLKAAGRVGEAMRDFRELAETNPRHTDAVREVRLYSMRQERDRRNKDQGTGSLLGKFSKK